MDDDTRDFLRETLIKEAVGLAVLLGVLWVMGPGKVWLEAAAHKVGSLRKGDPWAGAVRQFAREVSEWDHEQAAQADSKPAPRRPGGCGCGG